MGPMIKGDIVKRSCSNSRLRSTAI